MPAPRPEDLHHQFHDLLSLVRHREAVRRMREDPSLVQRALATLRRWMSTTDPRNEPLLPEWKRILEDEDWDSALQETERGDQLRRASPMVTVLPPAVRMGILGHLRELYRKFDEESRVRLHRRERTSPLILAARTSSTSYRQMIPVAEVEAALKSGVVPNSWQPHIRCLLEEAPEGLLLSVVEELHAKGGEPTDAIWERMHHMAKELNCLRTHDELWDAPSGGQPPERYDMLRGERKLTADLDAPLEDVIRDFHERGERAAAELRRRGESYSVEDVLLEMRKMTAARRRQLTVRHRQENNPGL